MTMSSSLAPIRDVMTMIRHSKIGRCKDGSIFVYVYPKGAISAVEQPADDPTAQIVAWLDRQGQIRWLASSHADHPDHARLTDHAERVRQKWQRRYPDEATKAVQERTRADLRSVGIEPRSGPPPLRMLPTPIGAEDPPPRRLRLVHTTGVHR